jgi:hypothetical protein
MTECGTLIETRRLKQRKKIDGILQGSRTDEYTFIKAYLGQLKVENKTRKKVKREQAFNSTLFESNNLLGAFYNSAGIQNLRTKVTHVRNKRDLVK